MCSPILALRQQQRRESSESGGRAYGRRTAWQYWSTPSDVVFYVNVQYLSSCGPLKHRNRAVSTQPRQYIHPSSRQGNFPSSPCAGGHARSILPLHLPTRPANPFESVTRPRPLSWQIPSLWIPDRIIATLPRGLQDPGMPQSHAVPAVRDRDPVSASPGGGEVSPRPD